MLTELIQAATIIDSVVSERMKVYEASFKFEVKNAPEYGYFLDIINSVSQRDKIKIVLQDETEQVYDFSLGNEEDYKGFINDTLEDEIINVKVKIDKEVVNNHFSIYAFDEFVKDILSLSLEEVMIAFSNLLKQSSNYLVFDVYSPVAMFATKTMFFVPNGNGMVNTEFNRKRRMEECREVSYFYNFDIFEVLPDDFKITIDYENNPLREVFQKIMVLLSISFIATSSTISNSQLKGIINGQRTMEYCCNISELPDNKILYSIYNWIYTDGNPIDKAIIVRNVISLHCKYVSITEIDEKVMASIQSNYNLYLKENVKAYLELKNKVAEFISDTVSRTGEYATGLLDKFKSNIIAILLYSVLIARKEKMLTNFVEYIKQQWFDRPDKSTPLSAQRLNHIEAGIKANSDALAEIRRRFLDAVYPVGSIYMSTNEANPADVLVGGTWKRIKDRFLLAAGDTYTAGITGGEETHTLTTSEIPDLGTFVALNWYNQVQYTTGIFKNGGMKTQDRTAPVGAEMGESYIKASGGGQSHNNMPPYLTVYVWKRIK